MWRPIADRAVLVASLGSDFYFAALKEAAVVIGNSSSGLIEAPAAGTPTVNIGIRQDGRPRSASVIDCADRARRDRGRDPPRAGTGDAARCLQSQTPAYGRAGDASRLIFERLRRAPLEGILVKRFHRLPTWLRQRLGRSQ